MEKDRNQPEIDQFQRAFGDALALHLGGAEADDIHLNLRGWGQMLDAAAQSMDDHPKLKIEMLETAKDLMTSVDMDSHSILKFFEELLHVIQLQTMELRKEEFPKDTHADTIFDLDQFTRDFKTSFAQILTLHERGRNVEMAMVEDALLKKIGDLLNRFPDHDSEIVDAMEACVYELEDMHASDDEAIRMFMNVVVRAHGELLELRKNTLSEGAQEIHEIARRTVKDLLEN